MHCFTVFNLKLDLFYLEQTSKCFYLDSLFKEDDEIDADVAVAAAGSSILVRFLRMPFLGMLVANCGVLIYY